MTRREIIASASAALAANAATARFADAKPTPIAEGPTVDEMITLAERGSLDEQKYYGHLLGIYLSRFGSIARPGIDGTIAIYTPEPPEHGWRKRSIRDANRVVPADLAKYWRPANRGEEFPAGVPVETLPKDA